MARHLHAGLAALLQLVPVHVVAAAQRDGALLVTTLPAAVAVLAEPGPATTHDCKRKFAKISQSGRFGVPISCLLTVLGYLMPV